MDRIEQVQKAVDEILLNMKDAEERRCAYVHIYGVAQACALLAKKRSENAELAVIAGLLHDIHACAHGDWADHARKGSEMARSILNALGIFDEAEKDLICTAIYHHSDKATVNGSFDELLKDADVLQHGLYNPLSGIRSREEERFSALMAEFDLSGVKI